LEKIAMRNRWLATVLAAAGAAVALAACGSSTTSTPTSAGTTPAGSSTTSTTSSASGLKTMSTSSGTILVTASGMAVYWFAPDTSTASKCNSSCASYWPPLTGTPSLASGVTLPDKLGTITRSNGQTQATYDGHPLYTYVSDTTAGQISGNNLNASGGLWYVMTPNGTKISTSSSGGSGGSSPSPSSGSGSGGYGY
jgi:predicted lipoprotein with Yx(FWY)xxD motif